MLKPLRLLDPDKLTDADRLVLLTDGFDPRTHTERLTDALCGRELVGVAPQASTPSLWLDEPVGALTH